MPIKITSDSTSDLSPEQLKRYDIELFPLTINRGDEALLDGVDIVPADIFAYMEATGALCSTAAVNPVTYAERFEKLSREYDAVIHVDISSDFSSCYQNAYLASQEFDNVYVIDSRNLSTGHGHIVLAAAEMAEAGMKADDIVKRLEELTQKVNASFIVDRLEYLVRGGRCSSAAALGANMLKLKPCINVTDGKMKVGQKYRGSYKKCVREYVIDRIGNRDDLDLKRIFITHTPVAPEIVDIVRDTIKECAPFKEIVETNAGCTVSCHCGPGTLGILFITK